MILLIMSIVSDCVALSTCTGKEKGKQKKKKKNAFTPSSFGKETKRTNVFCAFLLFSHRISLTNLFSFLFFFLLLFFCCQSHNVFAARVCPFWLLAVCLGVLCPTVSVLSLHLSFHSFSPLRFGFFSLFRVKSV